MISDLYRPPDGVTLDSVLCTHELATRADREPRFKAESEYLNELARHLAQDPHSILQTLTEIILRGLAAGSAGVSLLNSTESEFYWPAIAGEWEPHIGGGTPRHFGPCGIVLDSSAVQLFRTPEKFYPYLQPASPKIHEVLLAPFYVDGIPVGTVWAVSHDFNTFFDREDARLLQSISTFAAAAFVCLQNHRKLKTQTDILHEAQERIETTLETTEIGTWVWDTKLNRVFADRNLAQFFSVSEGDADGAPIELYLKAIHPEDLNAVELEIQRAMTTGDGKYEVDYRLIQKDKSIRWVSARGRAQRNESGEVVRFPGVVIDVSRRKAAEDKARYIATENLRLLNELKATDKKKDEFLGTLAHELRNPLAPIRNAVQILKKMGDTNSKSGVLVEMMDRQVSHMVRLVDDLLEVSRIRWGKFDLKKESTSLDLILNEAMSLSGPLIESLNHRVEIKLLSDLIIEGDITRLVQVFSNLLNNAAKYTLAGGTIIVTSDIECDMAVMRIRDSGVGVAPDKLPEIFELFSQVDNTATGSRGGLGIGLSLAKSIVEMHKGSIVAHSEGLGKGTEIVVKLPLRRSLAEPIPGHSNEAPRALTTRKVLIVDDNKDAADSLSLALHMFGMDTRVVYGGAEALANLEQYNPDIVFLDLGMPRSMGMRSLKKSDSRRSFGILRSSR